MLTIGVDLASGEINSLDLFPALLDFSNKHPEISLWVYIENEKLSLLNTEYPNLSSTIKLTGCYQNIQMEDIPSKRLLVKKPYSSMVRGLIDLKRGNIDTFFSPGNTGAFVMIAREIIGLKRGVSLPALSVIIPREHDMALLLDVGIQLNIDEDRGFELARMGKQFYEKIFPEKKAQLSLLNVGKESYKGSIWLQKLNKKLKKNFPTNYYGFVEGFDIFKNSQANVFITGGYTGNLLLKSWEGLFSNIAGVLQKTQKDSDTNLVSLLAENFHYSVMGTGRVLGTRKPLFVGHGKTDRNALYSALYTILGDMVSDMKSSSKDLSKNNNFFLRILSKKKGAL